LSERYLAILSKFLSVLINSKWPLRL